MTKQKALIEIQVIGDTIQFMGKIYYSENYLNTAKTIEYTKGLNDGKHVHVAEIKMYHEDKLCDLCKTEIAKREGMCVECWNKPFKLAQTIEERNLNKFQ